jgi:putative glycosyltransferase (TIGR04372 family)
MGKGSKFKYQDTNVVDLAFKEIPDIVQLYLISKCEFLISYQTGFFQHLSYMFGTPILMLNVSDPVFGYPMKSNSRMVLKKLININNKKEEKFSIFSDGTLTKLKKENKFSEKYFFVENTEEEIMLSVKEMHYSIQNKFKLNNDQVFMRDLIIKRNIEFLNKPIENIGVYNYQMKWSGGDFIGLGAFCAWYAKKKRIEIELISE